MSKDLTTVNVEELIEEAAVWFTEDMSGRIVDADYTIPYYWGLTDEEKYAISYHDFNVAVYERVNKIIGMENFYLNYLKSSEVH